MTSARYALLGVGRARSRWFGDLASWATSGAVPADFSKCLSVNEARHRLMGLRPYSALLVESGLSGIDRDLVDVARGAGVPTIIVTNGNEPETHWFDLGVVAVMTNELTPATLLNTLSNHAQIITTTPIETATTVEQLTERRGNLIAVCGPGGTGASTAAIAIAQALAADVVNADHVLLADLARNGEQAMLHDSPDIVPGIEEVVDLHRNKRPTAEQLRDLTFAVDRRGYRLLLGPRRMSSWTSMTQATSIAAIDGLRRTFSTVVADITADFENEAATGSVDVEERNALTLEAVAAAAAVFVVGAPGMKGVHSLATTLRRLRALDIDPARVVPVVNRMPKRGTDRADVTRAIATLSKRGTTLSTTNAPVFVPDRALDDILRTGDRLPRQVVQPLGQMAQSILARTSIEPTRMDEPRRVTPGSLGFSDLDPAVGD